MLNIGDAVRVLPFDEIDCSFPAVRDTYDSSGCFGIDDYEINDYASKYEMVFIQDIKRNYELSSGLITDIYRLETPEGKGLGYWWIEGMIVPTEDSFDPSAAGDEDGLIGFILGTSPSDDD